MRVGVQIRFIAITWTSASSGSSSASFSKGRAHKGRMLQGSLSKTVSLYTLRPPGVIRSNSEFAPSPMGDNASRGPSDKERRNVGSNAICPQQRSRFLADKAFHMHLDNTYASRHPCRCKVGKHQRAMHRHKQRHLATCHCIFLLAGAVSSEKGLHSSEQLWNAGF